MLRVREVHRGVIHRGDGNVPDQRDRYRECFDNDRS
jgi:hypothetical protein